MSCPPSTPTYSVFAGAKRLASEAFPHPIKHSPSYEDFMRRIDVLERTNGGLKYENHLLLRERAALISEVVEATLLKKAANTTLEHREPESSKNRLKIENQQPTLEQVASKEGKELPPKEEGCEVAKERHVKMQTEIDALKEALRKEQTMNEGLQTAVGSLARETSKRSRNHSGDPRRKLTT
jgi:hypothetical protein